MHSDKFIVFPAIARNSVASGTCTPEPLGLEAALEAASQSSGLPVISVRSYVKGSTKQNRDATYLGKRGAGKVNTMIQRVAS